MGKLSLQYRNSAQAALDYCIGRALNQSLRALAAAGSNTATALDEPLGFTVK